MGHCPDCGAPCRQCASITEFTFMNVPEELRPSVKRLLKDVGCTTNARANDFISKLLQYEIKLILKCFRLWKDGGCVFKGKDERYFLGILRHNAVGIEPKLESLPPIAVYPKEDECECQAGDQVSTGTSGKSQHEQELPAPNESDSKDK